jgi:hypothetical protein
MSKEVSPRLIAVSKEISDILKRENLMGNFFIADGEGHGEYRLGLDIPEWSKIQFEDRTVKIGIHMESDPENSNKTVNALFNIRSMMDAVMQAHDAIVSKIISSVNIDEDDGKFVGRPE